MSDSNYSSTKINFGSEAFKKYFANTSWLFAEKITRLVLGFVIGIYMIRFLGPERFGTLSYAISFVGLFSALGTLGLDSIASRELVKTPERKNEILGSVFGLRIIGAIVAIFFTIFSAYFSGDTSETMLMILIIAVSMIFQSFAVIEYYFQSQVKARYSVLVQISTLLISGAFKIILMVLNAHLVWFACIQLLESIVLAVGFISVYRKQGFTLVKWKYNKTLAVGLLKDSWPLILSGVVIAIYMKVDQVIIKKMLDETQTGLYAAAVRLCETWYFIPMAFTASLYPAIIKARQMSEEVYFSRLQKLYDILAWIAISIALPVTLFSGPITRILLGEEYAAASTVLTIYIWAAVPTFLGVASSQYLITENLTRLSFYRTLAGMIVNVILNLIFIPIWGINGSAFATLISFSIATLAIATSRKTFHQLGMFLRAVFFVDLWFFIRNKIAHKGIPDK